MKNITNKIATGIASALVGLSALVSTADAQSTNTAAITKPKENLIHNIYADAGYYSMYLGTFGFSNSKGFVNQSDIGFNVGPIGYNIWENYDT